MLGLSTSNLIMSAKDRPCADDPHSLTLGLRAAVPASVESRGFWCDVALSLALNGACAPPGPWVRIDADPESCLPGRLFTAPLVLEVHEARPCSGKAPLGGC